MDTLLVRVLLILSAYTTATMRQSIEYSRLLIKEHSVSNSLTITEFLQLYNSMKCVKMSLGTDKTKCDSGVLLDQGSHDYSANDTVTSSDNQTSDVINATCLPPAELFDKFQSNLEIDAASLIESLPAVAINIKRCQIVMKSKAVRIYRKPSKGEAWGYGIGFAVLILLISNLGALLAPCMGIKLFHQILMFLVATAVGTLTATAILVLIPEALDLIKYEGIRDSYIGKMSSVCAALLCLFISERTIKYVFRNKRKNTTNEVIFQTPDDAKTGITTSLEDVETEDMLKNDNQQTQHGHSHATLQKSGEPLAVSSVAYMIVFGDGLHKFVDGLSVGAAFSTNLLTGYTVALAMICEEVAHEIGDVAILLHSGLSIKKALLYNSLAVVFCFVGIILGIILGESTSANSWIFAIAAGVFLYVALVDMVPEMAMAAETAINNDSSPFAITLFQIIGLVVGFVVIYLVAAYVGEIDI